MQIVWILQSSQLPALIPEGKSLPTISDPGKFCEKLDAHIHLSTAAWDLGRGLGRYQELAKV